MTAAELKRRHETAQPESHFFSRETMRHWQDTMKNFRVWIDEYGYEEEPGSGCWAPIIVLERKRSPYPGARRFIAFDEDYRRRPDLDDSI